MSTKINPSLNEETAAKLSEYTHLVAVPELPIASIEYKDVVYFLVTDGRLYRCTQKVDGSWMWQATTVSPDKTEQIDSILQSLIEQGSAGDPALRGEFNEYKTQMSSIISGLATSGTVFDLEQRLATLEASCHCGAGDNTPASNIAKIRAAFSKIAALTVPDPYCTDDLRDTIVAIITAAKDLVSEGVAGEGE